MQHANQAQQFFENLLKEYKATVKKQEKELLRLPEGRLAKRMVADRLNYIQLTGSHSKDGKQKRTGITNRKDLVSALARKKYLQISLERLHQNIALLEKLLKHHRPVTSVDILKAMPGVYKTLPESMFFPEQIKNSLWAKEEFEQSSYKPEERRHITAKGLRVRSKSEVIIADRLDDYGIPFRYEAMIHIENHSFSPDFTIKTHKLFYWEHCGMVSNKAYMQNHKWKLGMYEKAGIVPWENLIVSYDNKYGNIDTRIIDEEIKNKLL